LSGGVEAAERNGLMTSTDLMIFKKLEVQKVNRNLAKIEQTSSIFHVSLSKIIS
jgi:hypothetical protein